MWAFFFSYSFCVLPMNAKGVFIVCVYWKLYWLLILNITHHLCFASPALHHRHTPHITCLMVSAFLLAVCPAEITHQSKRWSRQLLTKDVLFLCSAPSALHHRHTSPSYFVSERFFLCTLIIIPVECKNRSEVNSVRVRGILMLCAVCPAECVLFLVFKTENRNSITKRFWVLRATTPPHIPRP